MGDPLRSVLCAVSLCGCFHGGLHNFIMVNCEEIYGVVKYRTELGGGWNLCLHSNPLHPPPFLEGRLWRAAGCRPYAV